MCSIICYDNSKIMPLIETQLAAHIQPTSCAANFWGLLNIAIVNAYILWELSTRPHPKNIRSWSLKAFKLAILHQLGDGFTSRKSGDRVLRRYLFISPMTTVYPRPNSCTSWAIIPRLYTLGKPDSMQLLNHKGSTVSCPTLVGFLGIYCFQDSLPSWYKHVWEILLE